MAPNVERTDHANGDRRRPRNGDDGDIGDTGLVIGTGRHGIRNANDVGRGIARLNVQRLARICGGFGVFVQRRAVAMRIMLIMVVIEVGVDMQRRGARAEGEDAQREHGEQAAAHEDECMSTAVGRQRPSLRFKCRTNAANVSRLT